MIYGEYPPPPYVKNLANDPGCSLLRRKLRFVLSEKLYTFSDKRGGRID